MSKIALDTTSAKSRARSALDAVPNYGRRGWDALEAKLACQDTEGKLEMKKDQRGNQPRFEAEWRWVCRMPSVTERLVVSSPSVCEVWAHRLLRQFSEPACVQHAAKTGHPIIASFEPGEDWFYDYEKRGDDQGGGVASATFASGASTITWTGRESSSQLGIAAALAGVDRVFMNGSGTRDAVFVTSTVSKGAINERRTSRTEEL
jgi:hypothetical protein